VHIRRCVLWSYWWWFLCLTLKWSPSLKGYLPFCIIYLGNLRSLKLFFMFILIFNFEFIPVDQMLVNPVQKLTETICMYIRIVLYCLYIFLINCHLSCTAIWRTRMCWCNEYSRVITWWRNERMSHQNVLLLIY